MKILMIENNAIDIDCVTDEIEDIRYCVFDGGDEESRLLLPLFLESFSFTCLQIGEYKLQMPMDWSILTG